MSENVCQENLIELLPDKTTELDAFISTLGISDDIKATRGVLIETLHKAQELFGYLPMSIQKYIAHKLKLHLSEIYGVISFYSFFTDVPRGKYQIKVCTGTACFVKGAKKILDELTRYLSIGEGETTDDLKFSIEGLRCVGACSLAPVVMVNHKVYGNVTASMVPGIIADCNDEEGIVA